MIEDTALEAGARGYFVPLVKCATPVTYVYAFLEGSKRGDESYVGRLLAYVFPLSQRASST